MSIGGDTSRAEAHDATTKAKRDDYDDQGEHVEPLEHTRHAAAA